MPGRSTITRVGLYGLLGSGNLGNDASFEVVREWLRREWPTAHVSAITNRPEVVRRAYGIPSRSFQSGHRLRDVVLAFQAAGAVDVVTVPGMGVLEETLGVRFWRWPFWLLTMALAARLRGRRFTLVAVGAEPVRSRITRAMFRATVRLATFASYRDAISADAMAGAGKHPRIVTPDLAFGHPGRAHAVNSVVAAPDRVVVGVLDYHGWADDRKSGAVEHRRYVDSMAEVVRLLLGQGTEVVLTGGDAIDVGVAEEISQIAVQAGALARPEVRIVDDYTELLGLVASAQAVVATRYHNLIAALSTGRPVVVVAYAEKANALATAFGIGGSGHHIDHIKPAELVRDLNALRDDPGLAERLRAQADVYAGEVEHAITRAFEQRV